MRWMIGVARVTGSKAFCCDMAIITRARLPGARRTSVTWANWCWRIRLLKVILEEYLQAIAAAGERIERCEVGMRALLEKWRLAPAVRALMAFKGFQTVAAMIVVSELGEVDRFAHPRQVMAYLGLVPTENTSNDKRRQGRITKCGNAHATLVAGGMRTALCDPAQGEQRV